MTLANVGWPDVVVALIAGLPGIIAAIAALAVRREVHTSNGKTLGESVEQAHAAAEQTRAVVTRTLGERHKDRPPDSGLRDHNERADSETGAE